MNREGMEGAFGDLRDSYQRLVEAAPDVMFSLSPEGGTLTMLNPAFERLTGWPCAEWLQRPFMDLVYPADRAGAADMLRQALDGAGPLTAEYRFLSKSGRFLTGEVIVTPYLRDRQVVSVLGFLRDVTDRKWAQEDLHEAGLYDTLGKLASGVAQDFNNALSSVIGNIYLAKRHTHAGDGIHERLAEAERVSFAAKELTSELLLLAGIDGMVRRTASVTKLIESAVSSALVGKSVRCEFSISDGLWQAEFNEERMRRVLHDIVANARRAMDERGVIKVSATNVTVAGEQGLPLKEGKYVRISVQDRGPAIPPEELALVFTPYFSTKESLRRKGTGLGLTIAYFLMRRSGGLITAESEEGVGTTFSIYLPASDRGTDQDVAGYEQGGIRPARKIMVMDDDEIDRAVAGEMLRRLSCEVVFARDGREAIDAYREAMERGHPFDALIMDLIVPDGSGAQETIDKLREIDPGVKAIVTSGYSDDPIVVDFSRSGFAGALPKPYTPEELCHVLDGILPR